MLYETIHLFSKALVEPSLERLSLHSTHQTWLPGLPAHRIVCPSHTEHMTKEKYNLNSRADWADNLCRIEDFLFLFFTGIGSLVVML